MNLFSDAQVREFVSWHLRYLADARKVCFFRGTAETFTLVLFFETLNTVWNTSSSDLYSRGSRFISRLGHGLSWPRTFVIFLRSSKRMLVLHIEIRNDHFLLSRSQNVTVPSSNLQLYNISSWFSVVKYASILPSESYGTHGNCECSKSFTTHSNLSEAFNSKYRTKIEYFAGTRGRDIALI